MYDDEWGWIPVEGSENEWFDTNDETVTGPISYNSNVSQVEEWIDPDSEPPIPGVWVPNIEGFLPPDFDPANLPNNWRPNFYIPPTFFGLPEGHSDQDFMRLANRVAQSNQRLEGLSGMLHGRNRSGYIEAFEAEQSLNNLLNDRFNELYSDTYAVSNGYRSADILHMSSYVSQGLNTYLHFDHHQSAKPNPFGAGIQSLNQDEIIVDVLTGGGFAATRYVSRHAGKAVYNGSKHTFRKGKEAFEELFQRGGKASCNAPDRLLSAADLDRIADIRSSLGIGKKRNIAFGEGHVNGKDFGEILGVSGQNTPGVRMPPDRVFRTGVDRYDRAFDSEVYVLENFARRLNPTDSGTIRIVSENPFCRSCTDVIAQFEEMFPNIRLILVDGTP